MLIRRKLTCGIRDAGYWILERRNYLTWVFWGNGIFGDGRFYIANI